MVSVSGFRGRVGETATPELFARIAVAFGDFLRSWDSVPGSLHVRPRPHVLIARDSRLSGPMLAGAVRAGLQSVGVDVIDLGLAATPVLLREVAHGHAIGGVVITASHNPAEWNALKLVGPDGTFLDAGRSRAFQDRLANGPDAERAGWDHLGWVSEEAGAWQRHSQAILALPYIDVEAVRRRRLKVAADCVHGVAGPSLASLLEGLGCELVGMGMEPDGRFPRDPEPTPENLRDLRELVRSERADIGLAIDPDGDRLAIVDETGSTPGEDVTLGLAAATVLSREVGPVVANLSTSQLVGDVARAHSAPFHRAPVGEINVAVRMRREGAVVGGEGNGGVILPRLHLTRDAFMATALIIQHLIDADAPISSAIARWPTYSIVKRKAGLPERPIGDVLAAIERALAPEATDHSDGLHLSWPSAQAWLHVRPSGTEPAVRVIAEAPEPAQAEDLIARAVRSGGLD